MDGRSLNKVAKRHGKCGGPYSGAAPSTALNPVCDPAPQGSASQPDRDRWVQVKVRFPTQSNSDLHRPPGPNAARCTDEMNTNVGRRPASEPPFSQDSRP